MSSHFDWWLLISNESFSLKTELERKLIKIVLIKWAFKFQLKSWNLSGSWSPLADSETLIVADSTLKRLNGDSFF